MKEPYISICPACSGNRFVPTNVFTEGKELRACKSCGQIISTCTACEYLRAIRKFDLQTEAFQPANKRMKKSRKLEKVISKALRLAKSEKKNKPAYLDIGCADGLSLEVANDLGFRAQGVEPAHALAQQAAAKGLVVFNGFLQDANFPDNHFDVISLIEVIEHIPQPLDLLLEVRRILKPKGCLVITTGNTKSITFKALKGTWAYLQLIGHGGHISFFSPRSITVLGKRANLFVIKIKTRRVSLNKSLKPRQYLVELALKCLSEFLSPLVKALGLGHRMVVFMKK